MSIDDEKREKIIRAIPDFEVPNEDFIVQGNQA